MHMKISYETQNYLLNRYPLSFTDLLTLIGDKIRKNVGRDTVLYFTDREGDKIVVADDSDLANVTDVCKLEGRDICKLSLELSHRSTQKPDPIMHNSDNNHNACFDTRSYLSYLKRNIPKVQDEFIRSFDQGMPCEECLGVGHTKQSSKCEHCYGRGLRPLSKHMSMVMQYIDYKFSHYILLPLETFVTSEAANTSHPNTRRLNVHARGSNSSLDDDFSKADTKKHNKQDYHNGYFARDSPIPANSTISPHKLSQRDDFNKHPNDD